jgi:O-antigen ligase
MQTAQQTYTSPAWNRLPATTMPKVGMLAYARANSISAWLLALILPFWYLSDWFTRQILAEQGSSASDRRVFLIGFSIMLAAHLTLGIQAWIAAPFQMLSTWVGALLSIFFLLMVVLSPLSEVPGTSLQYGFLTYLAVVLLWLYWTGNYSVLRRALLWACWLQFAWWTVLLAKHGLIGGFGGIIGDINRNVTGTSALAALICGLLTPNRYLRWAAFLATVFFCTIVSSRGSLVALSAFIAVYYALHVGVFRAVAHGGLIGTCVALIVLAVPEIRQEVVDKVLHIYDPGRGIGSGFTGRTTTWQQAIEWFWKRPVFGYGFRATTHARGVGFGGVHSAYIKVFLEAGFVGGFFMVGALVVEAFRRCRASLWLRKLNPQSVPNINLTETLRLNVLVCATMCMTLTMWVYDQYYINLGSPVSVVLFLMLTAPNYITNQGALLRRL